MNIKDTKIEDTGKARLVSLNAFFYIISPCICRFDYFMFDDYPYGSQVVSSDHLYFRLYKDSAVRIMLSLKHPKIS